ncbi:MAG: ABC transporter, partial [Alphaproteobacteria bacterium]
MKPKEGSLTWVCGLSIHPHAKESGMYEQCHVVINSYISPEAGYFELTEWYYGVANSKVYNRDDITDEFLQGLGLGKGPCRGLVPGG